MKKIFVALLFLGCAYVAYPYFTLWRIEQAIHNRDVVTLDALVDWHRLRDSIKAEILATISQKTLGALADGNNGFANLGTVLGATLGSKMVDTIVDGLVSPQGLFQAAEKNGVILQNAQLRKALTYAFFISPTQFRAEFENRQSEPPQRMSIVMIFSGFEWKVSRVTMPTAAIETASKSLVPRSDRLTARPNNSTGSNSALSQEEANNPQQSWGFDGEPPEAVIKESGTRDGTS